MNAPASSGSSAATRPDAASVMGGWLARGLWFGLALAVLRAGVFFAMEHLAHGTDFPRAALRLAAVLPELALLAGGAGVAAALVTALVARAPVALRIVVVVLLACALQPLLAGAFEDPSRRIGWITPRGARANQVLAAAALLLSAALLLWTRRARARARGPLRRGLAALVPLALLALLPVAWHARYGRLADEMVVRDVVVEVPLTDPAFEVHRAREDAPPACDVITPSLEYEVDGADMPAVVLAPPASVTLRLDGPEGTLWLDARAGIDHRAFRDGGRAELAGTRVRFELAIEGERVFEREIAVETLGVERGVQQGTAWVDATGDGGLPVRAGDRLTLSTTLLGADGAEVVSEEPLWCGFGGLSLERRSSVPRAPVTPERPNIVLVVMDTQRADRMSVYGYDRETSPRLAALAERSLVYDQAYSASSWTWPSTASILTGRHPQEHGVQSDAACYLVSSLETLPEVLQRAGYTTAAFSANPLVVPNKNFDQGFESFEHGRGAFRQSDLVMPAILEWLDAIGDRRFFLYVQLTDPHVPLIPLPEARAKLAPDVEPGYPPYMIERANQALRRRGRGPDGELRTDELVRPEDQAKIRQQYDACVWTGDHWVGRLLDRLDALGLTERTLFVYTSDHGEELFEHGLVEHGKQLYSELVHVPLLLSGPGVPAGVRVRAPVSNRHLAPTLARVGGAELPGLEDAVDLTRPPEPSADDAVFFSTDAGWWNGHKGETIWGLRKGDWVLHFAPRGRDWDASEPAPDGQWRLYDLATDPGEQVDVADREPEVVEELRAIVLARVAAMEPRRVRGGLRAGEGTLEMLRDIGYIGD